MQVKRSNHATILDATRERPIPDNFVFVFGSNEAGRHGAGAAKTAMDRFGAIYGVGAGLQGSSYGIPTKDFAVQTLPLDKIEQYVQEFLQYAYLNPKKHFIVTRIGCGLAGYTDSDIAPMFKNAPNNCTFDRAWFPYLGFSHKYFNKNL